MSSDASDHLLFITALAVIHSFKAWQKVLVLVTSFTIGHAITLYLSALEKVHFPTETVEFAIPCTIVLTALLNLVTKGGGDERTKRIQYPFALIFGLIHGMGFANSIRFSLQSKKSLFGRNSLPLD